MRAHILIPKQQATREHWERSASSETSDMPTVTHLSKAGHSCQSFPNSSTNKDHIQMCETMGSSSCKPPQSSVQDKVHIHAHNDSIFELLRNQNKTPKAATEENNYYRENKIQSHSGLLIQNGTIWKTLFGIFNVLKKLPTPEFYSQEK